MGRGRGAWFRRNGRDGRGGTLLRLAVTDIGGAGAGQRQHGGGGTVHRYPAGHEVGEGGERNEGRGLATGLFQLREHVRRHAGAERIGAGGYFGIAGAGTQRAASGSEISSLRRRSPSETACTSP